MADPDTLIKSKIHYFAREKYYHSMQVAAVEGMKRFSGDPVFRYFYGVALVLEGRTQEGIRELDPLQGFPEVTHLVLKSNLFQNRHHTHFQATYFPPTFEFLNFLLS